MSSYCVSEVVTGIMRVTYTVGPRAVHFYALREPEGWTLWDAGLPGFVREWWKKDGKDLPIRRIVLSHADADHLGDVDATLQYFPDAYVFAHEADCRWIEDHGKLISERYDCARPRFGYGYSQGTLKAFRQACGGNIHVTNWLQGGEILSAGGREWKVLSVPGHSPGHIALWCEREALLLLGDAVLGFGVVGVDGLSLTMPPTHQFISDYLETLSRLKELPVKTVLTGHWPALGQEEFHALIADSEACVERDLALVDEILQDGPRPFSGLLEKLCNSVRRWPEAEDIHYFYALNGYLELREQEGRVRVNGKKEIVLS